MKKIVYFTFMLIIISFFMGCKSYEERMAEFAKEADEFKSNLPPNTDVLCVITDSIATKVFYREADSSSITVYDLETDSKTKIALDETYYYGHNARRYNDRLFVIVETGACGSGLGNQQCVFYINVRDNSSHLVTCCEEASFLNNEEIHIRRAFPVDDSGPSYEWEWQRDEYELSTSLSNEEYASREKMQEEKEEAIAREERNRPKEIHLNYSITFNSTTHSGTSHAGKFHDYSTTFGGGPGGCDITTGNITVPYGKIWTLKDIRSTNTRNMIMIYMENETGNRYKYCEPINTHGTILYGGQTFRLGFITYGGTHDYDIDIYFIETRDESESSEEMPYLRPAPEDW